ncbi:MAG: MlaD family protein [Paracoccaceae bacterium]
MTEMPPEAQIEPARRAFWQRASIVWLIPIIALTIALGVAWQAYEDRGPLIEVEFTSGAGVAAGQTELRFRDVTVGLVERVRFTKDLGAVIVSIRVDKDVAPFVDTGAKFWVVRPKVTARGITGLDTVLSGVFIEGSWNRTAGTPATSFVGLDDAPLFRPGEVGLQIALRANAQSSLTDDAPILYRGIEVGRIGQASISPRSGIAVAEAIIYEPHSQLITDATRFWEASGFEVSLSASGADINFSSLASLISGGIAFDTLVSGGQPVQDGAVFQVYYEEADARASIFSATDVETLDLSVLFKDNVAGLVTGAPVELRGIRIGDVSHLGGVVVQNAAGKNEVQLNVTLAIQPSRMGLSGDADAAEALVFLQEQTRAGLRARLATASLLTGGLKVELVTLEDQPVEEIDLNGDPFPTLPSVAGEITDISATAEGVLNRIDKLPIEELLGSAIDFLNATKTLVTNEDLQGTPGEVRGLLADLRALVGSQEVQEVPALLNATLVRVETLMAQIEGQKTIEKLVAAVEAAGRAAGSIETAAAGAPALVSRIEAVAAKAENLNIEDLLAQATELVDAAKTLIGSEDTAALPAALTGALTQIEATLSDLRNGGAIENTNKTLASAQAAAEAVAVSVKDLPALMDRMAGVLTQVSATLQAYGENSALNRDARAALLEINRAAKSFESLARAIERNPNSLLLGR